jgi:hypothetical protein
VYRASVIASMVYDGETWVMRKYEESVLQRAERTMLRMMCGVKLKDKKSRNELMSILGLNEDIVTLVRKSRLTTYSEMNVINFLHLST